MSSVVPEGWELSPLSSLADYKNGRAFKPSDWSKSGLPILRIAQINNPHKVEDYYDGDDIDDGHFITKGDLIFSWSATLKAEIWSHYDAVLNQHIFKVTEKVGTNRSYLQQLLDYAIPKLAESSHGSTMKHIKKGVLDEFFSPVPPLPEQKKIASILTSVDEVIENTQKQIDKLQDLKKATMNELLTKGIGHTEFKDSELGRIPKSWEVIALAELLELKNGLNTNADAFGSGSPFLSYKDIYKDTELTEMSLSQKVEVSERENNSFSVNYGDVFFTRTSETPEEIGFANVYLGANVGAVFNGFCIRGRPITNKLSVRLSRFLFRSDYVRVQMRFLCKYTTRAGISGESLNRCLLAVPPIDEQEKYLKTLDSIEKMIEAAGKKLHQTQSLKKSLMQDLLTGKVRVTVN
jgi:type I restriction enzyme S subunit